MKRLVRGIATFNINFSNSIINDSLKKLRKYGLKTRLFSKIEINNKTIINDGILFSGETTLLDKQLKSLFFGNANINIENEIGLYYNLSRSTFEDISPLDISLGHSYLGVSYSLDNLISCKNVNNSSKNNFAYREYNKQNVILLENMLNSKNKNQNKIRDYMYNFNSSNSIKEKDLIYIPKFTNQSYFLNSSF